MMNFEDQTCMILQKFVNYSHHSISWLLTVPLLTLRASACLFYCLRPKEHHTFLFKLTINSYLFFSFYFLLHNFPPCICPVSLYSVYSVSVSFSGLLVSFNSCVSPFCCLYYSLHSFNIVSSGAFFQSTPTISPRLRMLNELSARNILIQIHSVEVF